MPGPGAAPPPTPAGPTSPAATRPDSGGMQQRGRVLVGSLGMKILVEALKLLGADTKEGKAVLKALTSLSGEFGNASEDLGRAEMKLLQERMPSVAQPGPGMKDAIQQRLGSMGMGGGQSPAPPMAGAA